MNFNEILDARQKTVEGMLTAFLPISDAEYNQVVLEAMRYSLMAGGKRIRPIFMQEAFSICDGYNEKALRAFMAAIEMIHTYSLIHDDLPAMDNDDLRRGLPTCHVKFGENVAILAGDALLNRAFEIMADSALATEPVKGLKAMQAVAAASGSNGMIGGQIADVLNENKQINMECLNYIHHKKTSAIIEASFMAGALLAGASEEIVDVFEQVGRRIGLAFQIQDDVLDIIGDEAKLGKPTFSDEKNQKTTYVTLIGLEKSKETAKGLLTEATELLKSLKNEKTDFMVEFVRYLQDRQA